MTRDEVKSLLLIMEKTYANFRADEQGMVDVWHLQLAEDDYNTVKSALITYNRTNTSGFAPSIGQLLNVAYKMQNSCMNEMEAWEYIRNRISSSSYYSKENWETLPETLKRVVSAEQLREWAMDENFNESVAQSNFIKAYRTQKENEMFQYQMPEYIKTQLTGTTKKLIGVGT